MDTNDTNKNTKIIYGELSYKVNGICFAVHNEMGRFAKEKQYGDLVEEKLKESKLSYNREKRLDDGHNIIDFVVEDKLILELKAKRLINKEDFYQLQRYLQMTSKKLGLMVNFRNRYIKPIMVVRIETDARKKFL